MIVTLIRLLILYGLILMCMRLMGRRQIGELQPSELVVTMLLSEIASIPLENGDIPLLNSVAVILVLTALEVLLSALSLKSDGVRRMLQGNPMPVIQNGKPIQKTLRQLRLTVDDLMEALREKDVFRISDVQLAVLEANGRLTLQVHEQYRPVTPEQLGLPESERCIPCPIIFDGKIQTQNFSLIGMTADKLQTMLRRHNVRADEVFLLTVDQNGNQELIRKENPDA